MAPSAVWNIKARARGRAAFILHAARGCHAISVIYITIITRCSSITIATHTDINFHWFSKIRPEALSAVWNIKARARGRSPEGELPLYYMQHEVAMLYLLYITIITRCSSITIATHTDINFHWFLLVFSLVLIGLYITCSTRLPCYICYISRSLPDAVQ